MSFLIQDVTDGKLVKIAEDALDVADRIREIDEGYEIYYNRAKNRFEIYKKENVRRFCRLTNWTKEP